MLKGLFLIAAITGLILMSFFNAPKPPKKWVCKPCGGECDKEVHDAPGQCAYCHMPRVDAKSIQFKNIPLSNVCEKLKDPSLVLLDVRTPEEFNGTAPDKFGRIRNAINIPIQELESRLNELDAYRNKEILVYCSHSHRSPQAAWLLNQNGFKKVDNLLSGMSAWDDSVHCDSFRIK
jgi:rhodanese-related sulfurtransferase